MAKSKQKQTLREKVAFYLDDTKTITGKAIDIFIISLNLFTVFMFILESYYHDLFPKIFWTIEIATVSIFIIEYVVRMFAAENRIKHFFNIYTLIDLIAIIPTFIAFLDLRFIRILRVFRIFRFLRFLETAHFFFGNITIHHLRILRIFFTIITIVFVFSAFIWKAEMGVNPMITDLGSAIYFSIVTLTTVGFGDIVPVTPLGRLITTVMIISGIILIPWQVGLLIREFISFSHTEKKRSHLQALWLKIP
jgi:voltage-gated potassium channel